MSLMHCFSAIPKDCEMRIIEKDMVVAQVSDDLLRYVDDSLKWINTISNGKKNIQGLSYYGYSIIVDKNINKLRDIVEQWIALFNLANDDILLTGDFQVDELKYEQKYIKKEIIIQELYSLLHICETAINIDGKVLYNGI